MVKAKASAEAGTTVICLTPTQTDGRWWHQHVMQAAEIRFCNRRPTFVGASNDAPFRTAVIVFGSGDSQPIIWAQAD